MNLENTITAAQAALDAGQAILDLYQGDIAVEMKENESPLTAADTASHRVIVDALARSGYPLLSEESSEEDFVGRRDWKRYWLIDPLDGTKEFIKRNGEFTVNIALIDEGVSVFGVVYVPVTRTLYLGVSAGEADGIPEGAYRTVLDESTTAAAWIESLQNPADADRISVSHTPATPLRVVASKSHCNDETLEYIAGLEATYGPSERVSRGSSLKLCMVAEGAADIYPRIAPTMEWDTAAAHAVVTSAGGTVCQYPSGDPLVYNKDNLLNPYFVVSGIKER
jgi:3'(2'), 5'-bisphosphate nucleotidase